MKHAKKIIEKAQMFAVCSHIEKVLRVIARQPIEIHGDEYHYVFIWCTKCHVGFPMPDSHYFDHQKVDDVNEPLRRIVRRLIRQRC